jgi:hypothetical protein
MAFHNLFSEYRKLRVIKSRRMRLNKHVALMRKVRSARHIFVAKCEGKITREKPKR